MVEYEMRRGVWIGIMLKSIVLKSRLLLLILLSVLSSVVIADDMEAQLFDKIVEIQQHSRLSIHIDNECHFLSADERKLLEMESEFVGKIIAGHHLNQQGESANIYIDVKMEERHKEINLGCNDVARNEVFDSLRVLGRFVEIVTSPDAN